MKKKITSGKSQVSYNDIGLGKLKKLLKGKKVPRLKLGVIGDGVARSLDEDSDSDALTNAEIGAIHELGLGNNPVTSWLRMPMINNFKKKLRESGLDDDVIESYFSKDDGLVELFKKLGLVGEEVVQDAFQSGGDGKWPSSDMTRKKNQQTLVETQQLRDSVTSQVIEK